MIQLGKLTQQALNKQFPDNWQSMAVMMAMETEYDKEGGLLYIHSGDDTLVIHDDNSIECEVSLPKELIAQIIVHMKKQEAK